MQSPRRLSVPSETGPVPALHARPVTARRSGLPLATAHSELFVIDRRAAVHTLRNMLNCPAHNKACAMASSKINTRDLRTATADVPAPLPTQGLSLLLLDVVEVLCAVFKHDPRNLHHTSRPSRFLVGCSGRPPRSSWSHPAAVDLAARTLHLSSVTMPLSSNSLTWPLSLRNPLAAFAPLAKPRHDRTTSSSGASRPSRPAASTAAHAPWCLRRRLGPALSLCAGAPRACTTALASSTSPSTSP